MIILAKGLGSEEGKRNRELVTKRNGSAFAVHLISGFFCGTYVQEKTRKVKSLNLKVR